MIKIWLVLIFMPYNGHANVCANAVLTLPQRAEAISTAIVNSDRSSFYGWVEGELSNLRSNESVTLLRKVMRRASQRPKARHEVIVFRGLKKIPTSGISSSMLENWQKNLRNSTESWLFISNYFDLDSAMVTHTEAGNLSPFISTTSDLSRALSVSEHVAVIKISRDRVIPNVYSETSYLASRGMCLEQEVLVPLVIFPDEILGVAESKDGVTRILEQNKKYLVDISDAEFMTSARKEYRRLKR